MKVLVTGGAGFIGSHVAEYYASKGFEVVVYDNFSRAKLYGLNPKTMQYNLSYLRGKFGERVRVVEGDVRDYEALSREARDADLIVHAAAQVAVTTSIADPNGGQRGRHLQCT